jgi:hypothetical protein
VPKAQPVVANLAVNCPNCDWRNYPRPQAVPGSPGRVEWVTPPTCSYCGEPLEPAAPKSF